MRPASHRFSLTGKLALLLFVFALVATGATALLHYLLDNLVLAASLAAL
jgi:hypothetical protein